MQVLLSHFPRKVNGKSHSNSFSNTESGLKPGSQHPNEFFSKVQSVALLFLLDFNLTVTIAVGIRERSQYIACVFQ